ncbi:MAG TPA: type I pullulanase [Erysipelothrix sp.]|nr:type I pullulanase [Erysipelothrix sp.]
MEHNSRISAQLDDYQHITFNMSRTYYSGKSNVFYLRNPRGEISKLSIKNVDSSNYNYTRYTLICRDDLIIGDVYDVLEEHGLSTPLRYGLIVQTERFDREFFNDRSDFGVHVFDGRTRFVLWAPTANAVTVKLMFPDQSIEFHPLKREEKGAYVYEDSRNLHGVGYLYAVQVNGGANITLDPYAYGSVENSKHNVVVDFDQLSSYFYDDKLPRVKSHQVTICELSVRDFSIHPNSGINQKGTFLGFMEQGTTNEFNQATGFDHLLSMGYTHIQLMPIFDYQTVDELNPELFYNWGYDPIQYNCVEGSLSSDARIPLARIVELQELISKCHKHGLHVTMDVVYNHVFDEKTSPFEQVVPNYYFRQTNGVLSNGSFCGNDFDSTKKMGRKFIVDSVKHWVEHYHVDGFRFDLMGILDIETMNEVKLVASSLRPRTILYGEGWNMPTMLADDQKASMYNADAMPEIGFFNDFFRDHVKGPSSYDKRWAKGYCLGDPTYVEAMKASLVANVLDNQCVRLFSQPQQSINYVECHDNATLWDKLKEANREERKEERIKRQKLTNAAVLLAQGIPFMHYGQEMCRTKFGEENSYRSTDEVNQVDYSRLQSYQEVVEYTRDMIKLRKKIPAFSMGSAAEIAQHVDFEVFHNSSLVYKLVNVARYGEFREVYAIFNPSYHQISYPLAQEFEIIADENGLIETDSRINTAVVPPISVLVIANRGGQND